MSSKAAPRKIGALTAAAFALASIFNTGASAQETFRVGGNFSRAPVFDLFGIELPGCLSGMERKVTYVPRPLIDFAKTDNFYFAFDYTRTSDAGDGPTVFYNADVIRMMPKPYQLFLMYNACILNYYSEAGLRPPINPIDYTIEEIKADCSTVIRLREENRFSPQDLQTVSYMLDSELRARPTTPPSAKTQRRLQNIAQCYYRNMTTENITPAAKPSRG